MIFVFFSLMVDDIQSAKLPSTIRAVDVLIHLTFSGAMVFFSSSFDLYKRGFL